ncbi:Hypothetical protein FKW44_020290 [Caligus rogercresseyi]|uniref:Uncharacterized protein n=1 Tax=Caligus rogercresseyi TaxID=217165 RepID=A0A7T8JYT3_CALRO|nr:Hypothetical protein FKW44_020290 [Caligus rogercresseyi]
MSVPMMASTPSIILELIRHFTFEDTPSSSTKTKAVPSQKTTLPSNAVTGNLPLLERLLKEGPRIVWVHPVSMRPVTSLPLISSLVSGIGGALGPPSGRVLALTHSLLRFPVLTEAGYMPLLPT